LKNYIIWQPDLNIEYDDFELQADTSIVKQFKNLWISSSCKVKILVVMDIPKQNRRFSFKQEKVYIAPVFCKQLSCNIAKQPKTLEYAKLQLDLAEWCARKTRKRIADLSQIKHAKGLVFDSLPGIVNEMNLELTNLVAAFNNQVMIKKKEGAFKNWREKCYGLLNENKSFATNNKDYNRFVNETPESDDYKEVFKSMGE
jgi:hypothetical protein